MTPKEIFETGLQYHHYANTAYPLTPKSFKDFRINNADEYKNFLIKEWSKTNELSLYVHIPFCKLRCKFCEYAVLDKSDKADEDLYVSLLLKEIAMYRSILKNKTIIGYDIGGGTPTKLSIENLRNITIALKNSFNFDKKVIFSIETTPIIAANETDKLNAIFNMGYNRISMGIQTISEKLLNELGREGTTHIYEKASNNIRKAGFKMLNIDLMYGFLHQTNREFENTIQYAMSLNPEYITLYRNRYKGTKLEKEAEGVSLYKIINQYRLAFDLLNKNGYYANPGKNTFSSIKNNYGTSDYLTKRVIYGIPYVGMGLGAQSFGIDYLSYNQGAASKKLNKYKEKIQNNEFPIQDIYALEKEESIAKMVSVAFYFGFIDLNAFQNRFKISFLDYFKDETDYVLKNKLMEINKNQIKLTNRGADYINGIIPLFYSKQSKKELISLYNKKPQISNGEKQFLKAYNINEYKQPSVATDIVIIALDNYPNNQKLTKNKDLQIILIKRGEHPFMNSWALPGGFVRPNESVEQTALRELKEETGIDNIPLSQLQVFSEPKRDPRGWIISCSFMAVTGRKNLNPEFGDDAIDVQLFKIKIDKKEKLNNINETNELMLIHENIILSAKIEKQPKSNNYKILESKGIAFDHAKIIFTAIEKINYIY